MFFSQLVEPKLNIGLFIFAGLNLITTLRRSCIGRGGILYLVRVRIPNKHETLTQFCFIVGPAYSGVTGSCLNTHFQLFRHNAEPHTQPGLAYRTQKSSQNTTHWPGVG